MAAQVLLVQAVVAALVVLASLSTAYLQAGQQVEQLTSERVRNAALAIAATDDVIEGLRSADPAATLASFVERERVATGTDFIVVMSPAGIRYTHPNPDLVGESYVGTIAPALNGEILVETYTGSLGPSTRSVVPVVAEGQIIGLVSVGLTRVQVGQAMRQQLPQILLPGLAAAILAGAGAWLVAKRVRSQTLGLNAHELARLVNHHDAVLHAIREGLVITDADGRVQVVNDEAKRLLGLSADDIGRALADTGLPQRLTAMMTAQGQRADVPHAAGGRVLLVSSSEVRRDGRVVGSLTTLRDRTELEELTGELGSTRSLADALHAQAHEAANRLHTVVTMVELGHPDEAVQFATAELQATQRQRAAILFAIEDPGVAALLLGKAAQAEERGVRLELDPDGHLPAGVLPTRDVVLILGNLIDNALDATQGTGEGSRPDAGITVDAQVNDDQVILTVADNGPGLTDEAARHGFERGWSTKAADSPAGRGLGLALVAQTIQALGGTITVSEPPGAVFTVRLPRLDAGGPQ